MAFMRHSKTPLPLILDSFRLKRGKFVAVSEDGLEVELLSQDGESFTFYENLIRRDYLRHGIQLGPGDTVIDIGANVGLFAILAARIVGPQGKVFAFEPASATFARLERNIKLNNFRNVTAINAAIGAANGEAQLCLSDRSAYAALRQAIGGSPESSPGVAATETVRVRALASVIEEFMLDRVKLLKLDCEGAEYDIFGGLTPEIAQKIEQISMEVHKIPGHLTAEIPQMLDRLGFATRETYPMVAFRRDR
jgi:FkbM family methyltransferase